MHLSCVYYKYIYILKDSGRLVAIQHRWCSCFIPHRHRGQPHLCCAHSIHANIHICLQSVLLSTNMSCKWLSDVSIRNSVLAARFIHHLHFAFGLVVIKIKKNEWYTREWSSMKTKIYIRLKWRERDRVRIEKLNVISFILIVATVAVAVPFTDVCANIWKMCRHQ